MSEIEKQIEAFFDQPLHKDHVGQSLIIDDADIETQYLVCKWIVSGGPKDQRYLRITADDNSTDIETRVLYSSLIAMGWTPPVETFPVEREKGCEQPHI